MGNDQRRSFGKEFLPPDQSLELPPSAEEGDAVLRLKDREEGREGLLEMARGRDDEENENKQISLCEGGDPSLHPFIRMKWWWRVFLSLFPKL